MNFEKYLNLPLYYESEKEDIISAVKEAIQKTNAEEKKKYSVINIRNSLLKADVLEEIEDE